MGTEYSFRCPPCVEKLKGESDYHARRGGEHDLGKGSPSYFAAVLRMAPLLADVGLACDRAGVDWCVLFGWAGGGCASFLAAHHGHGIQLWDGYGHRYDVDGRRLCTNGTLDHAWGPWEATRLPGELLRRCSIEGCDETVFSRG